MCVLREQQYRFRTTRTTSLALIEIVEEILSTTENNEYTVGTFLDIKKVSGRTNHGLLLRKLERHGGLSLFKLIILIQVNSTQVT